MDKPTRANPSTDAYERARNTVMGWVEAHFPRSLLDIPDLHADLLAQLIDSLAWEIDAAVIEQDNAITALGNLVCAQAHELRAARALVDSRAETIDALTTALGNLARELRGQLEAWPLPTTFAWGTTNFRCVERRLREAGDVLAANTEAGEVTT